MLIQIFALEGVNDNISLDCGLVKNPRLILWSEPDEEPVYELPEDEFEVIKFQCDGWDPEEEIKVLSISLLAIFTCPNSILFASQHLN